VDKNKNGVVFEIFDTQGMFLEFEEIRRDQVLYEYIFKKKKRKRKRKYKIT
jgi:hypothetical protein